jgi:hypothetical protein
MNGYRDLVRKRRLRRAALAHQVESIAIPGFTRVTDAGDAAADDTKAASVRPGRSPAEERRAATGDQQSP